MRIVQIVTQMESGGAQRVAYLLHKALEERGHDCELWFLYLKRPSYEGEEGIRCIWEHSPSALDYLRITTRLRRWIHDYEPDAIISHTHYANILGLGVGLLSGIKRRIAVQHNPVQTYPGLSQQVDYLCGSLHVYTGQVAVSDAVVHSMAQYPSLYRDKVRRIYNGVKFTERNGESHLPVLGKLPHDHNRILHVGRFSPQKNHAALLQVLSELPDANLVLVGDGELRANVEREAGKMMLLDRITFLGEISPSEVRAVMRSCELFMFPSRYEAMPMALLEAMASAMPIIASDIPANRELLQDGGILVPLDSKPFASAALGLLKDPVRASELGKKAAARASRFTVASMADAYEDMLLAS